MEGWTLHYGLGEALFGSEQYFPGGSVQWRDASGLCLHGRWEADDGLICFIYEDDPDDRRCWAVALDEGRVTAWLPGGAERPLVEAFREKAPLDCPGPGLGA